MHSPALGRERVFEHASNQFGTSGAILRLNYAIDLRYGILIDIAEKVYYEKPVDLTMGAANVIWQGDANAVVLRALMHCQSPPMLLNLTGPEIVSICWLATRFGEIFGKAPAFEGIEAETALLSNAARCHQLFGYPRISLEQMVQMGGTLDGNRWSRLLENRPNLKYEMASFEFQNVLLANRHLPRRRKISRCERVKIEATGDKLTQLVASIPVRRAVPSGIESCQLMPQI